MLTLSALEACRDVLARLTPTVHASASRQRCRYGLSNQAQNANKVAEEAGACYTDANTSVALGRRQESGVSGSTFVI